MSNTKEEFINRFKKKHGNLYDYSNVEYRGGKIKVEIFCNKHQEYFWQYPIYHQTSTGCKKCIKEKQCTKRNTNRTLLEAIRELVVVHGDKYDYSNVVYINTTCKITIICKEHGEFEQSFSKHLAGQGCGICARILKTTKLFVEQASIKHNNFYDYSKVEYKKGKDSIDIICPIHGLFSQVAINHLSGKGCSQCGRLRQGCGKYRDKDLKRKLRSLSTRIRTYFRGKEEKKSQNVRDIIGCTPEELNTHLENNPYDFKVADTDMDLDHIVPMLEADTIEEAYLLNHYTNLQLLPSEYNRNIKRENKWDRLHFENWLKETNYIENKII